MPGSATLAALGNVSLCPLLLLVRCSGWTVMRSWRGFGRRPVAVDHTLAEDPLLSLEAIADLADRFPGRVESHTADQPLVMPGGAPELELSPSEIVRGIEDNGCWMVFWYIHQDPAYQALLDRCLDEAESYLPSGAGRAIQREAFLFLSAPNAVTPIHFDPEHNFLLQIRGHKDMNVCPFPSWWRWSAANLTATTTVITAT